MMRRVRTRTVEGHPERIRLVNAGQRLGGIYRLKSNWPLSNKADRVAFATCAAMVRGKAGAVESLLATAPVLMKSSVARTATMV